MWGEAETVFKKDKYLKLLVEKWGSCTIKKSKVGEYFDDLAASIIEQQLSGKAAKAIYARVKNRVVENGNSPLSPSAILKVPDEDLRNCGISWGKVAYLKDLSQKVVGGKVKLEKLGALSDEEIISELIKVKGIGRWTAEMFLMFTLARPDIFPLDDLGIQKGFTKIVGEPYERKFVETFALRWKPYRTVASWYLWRSLENV